MSRDGQGLRDAPAPRDGTPLDRKLGALGTATDLGEDRLPEHALAAARQVVEHAGQRRPAGGGGRGAVPGAVGGPSPPKGE